MLRFSRRGFLCASAGTLLAQDSKFSTDSDVVTLLATVRDAQGQIVKNLTRGDFALFEDGVSQSIRSFTRESDLPLSSGLLIDTSRSQENEMQPERTASFKFLDEILRPDKDQAFVAHFDTRVEVLQGFASSRQDLGAALDQLEVPVETATLLYEAIRQTSDTMMRPRQGRKAIVLLSRGVSSHDKTSIGKGIESAQRANTVIYAILLARHGESAVERLADETGARLSRFPPFTRSKDAFARIEDALRNQYSLEYTPARSGRSAGYRKIKLTVKEPERVVRTRDGYYPR